MVLSLAVTITAAVAIARTVLPTMTRLLAKHATAELYQLTIIAFCLVGSYISGYLVNVLPFLYLAQMLCHNAMAQLQLSADLYYQVAWSSDEYVCFVSM